MKSSIQRRVADSFCSLDDHNWEAALLHIFPAIDASAKARRPAGQVGARFKTFIQDQLGIIAPIGLSVVLGRDCTFGGITLENALYELGRCTLVHEGGLPKNFQFTESCQSTVGGDWVLSHRFILALIIAVVSARENQGLTMQNDWQVSVLGVNVNVNELWGEEDRVREFIVAAWPTSLDLKQLCPYAT